MHTQCILAVFFFTPNRMMMVMMMIIIMITVVGPRCPWKGLFKKLDILSVSCLYLLPFDDC